LLEARRRQAARDDAVARLRDVPARVREEGATHYLVRVRRRIRLVADLLLDVARDLLRGVRRQAADGDVGTSVDAVGVVRRGVRPRVRLVEAAVAVRVPAVEVERGPDRGRILAAGFRRVTGVQVRVVEIGRDAGAVDAGVRRNVTDRARTHRQQTRVADE